MVAKASYACGGGIISGSETKQRETSAYGSEHHWRGSIIAIIASWHQRITAAAARAKAYLHISVA